MSTQLKVVGGESGYTVCGLFQLDENGNPGSEAVGYVVLDSNGNVCSIVLSTQDAAYSCLREVMEKGRRVAQAVSQQGEDNGDLTDASTSNFYLPSM